MYLYIYIYISLKTDNSHNQLGYYYTILKEERIFEKKIKWVMNFSTNTSQKEIY